MGRGVGPFSTDSILVNCDHTTRAGRIMQQTRDALLSDFGDEPTAAQKLLISAVALKATRMGLMADRLVRDDQATTNDHNALAYLNGIRCDLVALGLERRAKKTIDLHEYLRQKDAEKADAEKSDGDSSS